jgi:hypothetical protein
MTITITTILLVALVLGFWYVYSGNSSTNTTGSIDVDLNIKLDGTEESSEESSATVSVGFSGATRKKETVVEQEPSTKSESTVSEPLLKETVSDGKKERKQKSPKKPGAKRGRKPKNDKGNDLLLS